MEDSEYLAMMHREYSDTQLFKEMKDRELYQGVIDIILQILNGSRYINGLENIIWEKTLQEEHELLKRKEMPRGSSFEGKTSIIENK